MVLVATQVKRRRGTTAENDAFTGAEGEIVVDTERHELRVHDGTTQGGFTIPTTETMDSASKSLDNLSANGEARFTNKANSDLSNTPSNIDYVIETQEPTAENGYTWYRKYKSGWVEQGGRTTTLASGVSTITLPVAMLDTNYCTSADGSQLGNCFLFCRPDSTTQVSVRAVSGTDQQPRAFNISWGVVGMSAQ